MAQTDDEKPERKNKEAKHTELNSCVLTSILVCTTIGPHQRDT